MACADGELPGLKQPKDEKKPEPTNESINVPIVDVKPSLALQEILKKCPTFFECNKNKIDSLRNIDPDEITIEEEDESENQTGNSQYNLPQLDGSMLINKGLL